MTLCTMPIHAAIRTRAIHMATVVDNIMTMVTEMAMVLIAGIRTTTGMIIVMGMTTTIVILIPLGVGDEPSIPSNV